MENQNFTTTIEVDQSPEMVFKAINNVRGWWSKNIEGSTDTLNSEFIYRDRYLTAKMKITQFTSQKIVWDVIEANNKFFGEEFKDEWDGTKIIFEIAPKANGKTGIKFTHLGLVPQFECFSICSNSWTYFIATSLESLIETGKDISKDENSYTTFFIIENSPEEIFNAINNPRAWWSEAIEGKTDILHSDFFYHYKDVHLCKIEIVELIPNEKVVWFVKDNQFNFVKDQAEWKGTKIVFEISRENGKTQLVFTHHGLVPEYECYDICRDAWTSYIQGSLKDLITTGEGKPNSKEEELSKELIEKWLLPQK